MAVAAAVALSDKDRLGRVSVAFRPGISRRNLADSEYASDAQKRVDHVLNTDKYVLAVGLLSMFNLVIIVIDTDARAQCNGEDQCAPAYIQIVDQILLVVYTIDLALALFAQRCMFFKTGLNHLDLGIVVFGILEVILQAFISNAQGLSILRLLKMARISRVSKILRSLPELYKLVSGFMHTLKALTWGFVMILLLLLVWSVIIMQAYMALNAYDTFGDNDEHGCANAMKSAFSLVLMLWQTNIIGDNWGKCFVPLIMEHWPMYWIFAIAFICINLGFTNLILAVIVEKANAQHDEAMIMRTLEKSSREEAEIKAFRNVFEKLDKDGSNGLSIDEFLNGFEEFSDFKNGLLKFGIDKCDLSYIFACLDSDGSGEVGYEEFINAMYKSKRQDTGTQLMLVQMTLQKVMFMVQDMKHDVDQLKGDSGNNASQRSQRPKRISLFTSEPVLEAPSETLPKEVDSQEEPLQAQSSLGSRSTMDQSPLSELPKEHGRSERLHIQELERRLGHVAAELRRQGEALEREMQELADMASLKELCLPPKAANGISSVDWPAQPNLKAANGIPCAISKEVVNGVMYDIPEEASDDPLQAGSNRTILHAPETSLEIAASCAAWAKEDDLAVFDEDLILDETEELCGIVPGCAYLVKPAVRPKLGAAQPT